MRIARVENRPVLVRESQIIDIARASGGRFGTDANAPFTDWTAFQEWASTVDEDGEPLGERALTNPVPHPAQVFGVGANYRAHLEEASSAATASGRTLAVPTSPLIFTKFPSCLAGPFDPIPIPAATIDWEIELVVVIGTRAEHVALNDAWSHVAGLTVGQDITDRTLQFEGIAPQFSMGKSCPGFGPLGPWVVTPDELADPDNLELGCALDGKVMQRSSTSELIFSVPDLIARLSAVCPLLPGDLIFTGTPEGVGMFRQPAVFLQPGQELTSWIEGIGELRNPTIDAPRTTR
ncbi:fumarylacetoacetate hydrolase family protein [Mycolicibacterium moriokaense]|uniref:fumarylacetoacetate hydrolase family protein n=1 Tax=Mycolicibacterium moriokaense TaxID=39691 RepID=UPI000D76E9B8|nr:fumarylacetoacetate hydrolase family protein [Mycolicibacterium moriokaense]